MDPNTTSHSSLRILIIVLLIVIVGAGIYYYSSMGGEPSYVEENVGGTSNEPLSPIEEAKRDGASSFFFGGSVTKITGSSIYVKAVLPIETTAGIVMAEREKVVQVNALTEYYVKQGDVLTKSTLGLKVVTPGSKITIFTGQYPFDDKDKTTSGLKTIILAKRIEINK